MMQSGSHTTTFDGTELPAGIYYMMVNVNGSSLMKKVSVTK
jgi:hypothetical protein